MKIKALYWLEINDLVDGGLLQSVCNINISWRNRTCWPKFRGTPEREAMNITAVVYLIHAASMFTVAPRGITKRATYGTNHDESKKSRNSKNMNSSYRTACDELVIHRIM